MLQPLFDRLRYRAGNAPAQPDSQSIKFNLVITLDTGADYPLNTVTREPVTYFNLFGAHFLLLQCVSTGILIYFKKAEGARTIKAREYPTIVTGDSYVY